jgi:predicted 3-demethylubiquinone-9 3-methyltransferase (glyoxalase superfamily)
MGPAKSHRFVTHPRKEPLVKNIRPFLWFEDKAEEAKDFYLDVFEDSELLDTMPGPEDKPMGVTLRLKNLELTLFNGGPHFKLSEAFSLFVTCENQEEVDYFWDKLLEGGEPSRCGWLKDKYGVSWQIVPEVLSEVLGGSDPAGRERAMQAMLGMIKLDVAELQRAYEGA